MAEAGRPKPPEGMPSATVAHKTTMVTATAAISELVVFTMTMPNRRDNWCVVRLVVVLLCWWQAGRQAVADTQLAGWPHIARRLATHRP